MTNQTFRQCFCAKQGNTVSNSPASTNNRERGGNLDRLLTLINLCLLYRRLKPRVLGFSPSHCSLIAQASALAMLTQKTRSEADSTLVEGQRLRDLERIVAVARACLLER